jgi:hypothetical protein
MNKKFCLQLGFGLFFAILALGIYFVTTRADRAMTCVFCDIINKKTTSEILFEDEKYIAFRDIKPASRFHFLIIPKKHIVNTKALTTADQPMRKFKLILFVKF